MKNFCRGSYALLMLALSILILSYGIVSAETEPDAAFAEKIGKYAEDGLIPGTNGNFLSLGDYEDSFANMGYSAMTPLLEADHFVISAKLEWDSANQTPNLATNGCGFFFSAANGTNDHLMVSLRGDGNLYLSGYRNYTVLSYARRSFALPSRSGSAELSLIFDGSSTVVFLNGERFLQQNDLPVSGNVLGLAVLSGTFLDYGTKCNFEDIQIFTWE